MNVLIWNEFTGNAKGEGVLAVYPKGIHNALKDSLGKNDPSLKITTAVLEQPEHGLTQEVLDKTDVLVWWGHCAHDLVGDGAADRVADFVLRGGGIIFLHSSHLAKPFKRLMGTSCTLKWREAGEKEVLWAVNPSHPIAQGVPEHIILPHEEMYGEPFDIPEPDETVFIGWFAGGEVFRSGAAYRRGLGKVFYFQPGHETHPIYHDPDIIKIIGNAIKWAAPVKKSAPLFCPNPRPVV